ncbi:MAG: MotA/TolQ/ExbB proton channel family protein [Magnetovibrio sp.]|nr:MotA/TolQ/ExbB proton channel family protein [Magnetovibrio sp.]
MDFGTLAGLLVGITVVTAAISTGSNLSIFLNLPGFLIVMGGTFAATMVKFPINGVFIAMPVGFKAAFVNEKETPRDFIRQALAISKRVRKSGVIAAEKVKVHNPFFQKGLQLVADGRDLDYIRKVMTQDMALSNQHNEIGAKVFMSIAEFAPAFGMFGTLVGLIQMLSNMQDPTLIGKGMAVALLTTLYGVLLANLVAIPIADKLEDKRQRDMSLRSLIIECIFQIQQKQHPTTMMEILEGYLPEKQRQLGARDSYTTPDGKKDQRETIS